MWDLGNARCFCCTVLVVRIIYHVHIHKSVKPPLRTRSGQVYNIGYSRSDTPKVSQLRSPTGFLAMCFVLGISLGRQVPDN